MKFIVVNVLCKNNQTGDVDAANADQRWEKTYIYILAVNLDFDQKVLYTAYSGILFDLHSLFRSDNSNYGFSVKKIYLCGCLAL